MKKTTLDVTGMHCASCSTLINRALNKIDGVKEANVNLTTNKATVEFDESQTNTLQLIKTIETVIRTVFRVNRRLIGVIRTTSYGIFPQSSPRCAEHTPINTVRFTNSHPHRADEIVCPLRIKLTFRTVFLQTTCHLHNNIVRTE